MSWTNEASTNVSSFTICAKTSCNFAANSCFADSSIRKRTTRVILSDIPSPLSGPVSPLLLGQRYRELRASLVLCRVSIPSQTSAKGGFNILSLLLFWPLDTYQDKRFSHIRKVRSCFYSRF